VSDLSWHWKKSNVLLLQHWKKSNVSPLHRVFCNAIHGEHLTPADTAASPMRKI
jgi:hypothetical protein